VRQPLGRSLESASVARVFSAPIGSCRNITRPLSFRHTGPPAPGRVFAVRRFEAQWSDLRSGETFVGWDPSTAQANPNYTIILDSTLLLDNPGFFLKLSPDISPAGNRYRTWQPAGWTQRIRQSQASVTVTSLMLGRPPTGVIHGHPKEILSNAGGIA
jgi:hypothetical protein